MIFLLVFIWSAIGYRLVRKNAKGNDNLHAVEKYSGTGFDYPNKKELEFVDSNRDPFLDRPLNASSIKSKPSSKKAVVQPKKSKNWPSIEFFGFVKNQKKENPLIIVKVNGELNRVRKGKRIEDIFFKEVYNDSIILKRGKELKTFSRTAY